MRRTAVRREMESIMGFLSTMNIVGSGLTAQQLRLDIIAENVTNSTTTRVENGEGPYRRKVVVFEAETGWRSESKRREELSYDYTH